MAEAPYVGGAWDYVHESRPTKTSPVVGPGAGALPQPLQDRGEHLHCQSRVTGSQTHRERAHRRCHQYGDRSHQTCTRARPARRNRDIVRRTGLEFVAHTGENARRRRKPHNDLIYRRSRC